MFEVTTPPLNLTLNKTTQVTGNSINHMGIEVRLSSDVRKPAERLKHLGLDTEVEETTTCCHAIQDKVWIKDPDGNAWETCVVLQDTEEKYDAKKRTACCSPTEGVEAV